VQLNSGENVFLVLFTTDRQHLKTDFTVLFFKAYLFVIQKNIMWVTMFFSACATLVSKKKDVFHNYF
jgi:hypothetical protein